MSDKDDLKKRRDAWYTLEIEENRQKVYIQGEEITALKAKISTLETELAATRALLKDENKRRTMIQERFLETTDRIRQLLPPSPVIWPPPPKVDPDIIRSVIGRVDLDSPFYKELSRFGKLAIPGVSAELRNFTAKRVESPDPEKAVIEVTAEVFRDGRVGLSRPVKPGDYVRSEDGQIWEIIGSVSEAESIRKYGVNANGKRVIGYKEPEDRP